MPASLETRANHLDDIRDPADRYLAAHQLLAEIERVTAVVVHKRDAAILEAHENGASFADVAKRLGVSRTRVQQFIFRARDRATKGPAALRTKDPRERPSPKGRVPLAV